MRTVPLGDLISSSEPSRVGNRELPVLSMTMRGGLVDQSDKFKKRVASEDISTYKAVRRGQLVVGFPIDEGVLAFQRLHPVGAVSPAYGVWDLTKPDITCTDYLEKFLRSPVALSFYAAKLRSTTARRRSLTREAFLALPVPFPELAEQKRIAAILDQADALRRLRARALDRLNALGQAIFHDMFGEADTIKRQIKEVGVVTTGGTPPTSEASYYGTEVPFVTPGDLNSEVPAKRYLTHEGAAIVRTVAEGSALVCCIGATIGKMDIARGMVAFNQQINAVSWRKEVDPTYGLFALQVVRPEIERQGRGASTTLPILKKSSFEKIEIAVPPIEQQRTFAQRIEHLRKVKSDYDRQATAAAALFSALQQRAFSTGL